MGENPEGKLTEKQEKFCLEYLKDLNASGAARRAGYSELTASEQSSRLLSNVKVQNRIQELKGVRAKRTNITIDRVLKELARIAFVDIQDLVEGTNRVRNITSLKRQHSAAISSIKTKKVTIMEGDGEIELTEFKLHDKTRALELLGKHLGIYEKDNQQKQASVQLYLPDNGRNKDS